MAASAHAGCERFRLTDPLLTRVSRRALAKQVGFEDVGVGIPEARFMRAMTFEALVKSERFVSELLTKAIGQLGLSRPEGIRRRTGGSVARTATELAQAHLKANHANEATMITGLSLPFLDLEDNANATAVKPDFAIVCPRDEDGKTVGSWLIMGDAKDYERRRSRIDDVRLLKGFLQVALGAESAAAWSKLPAGMEVHRYGALAVPRNAFLQPEAKVEVLDDHRAEVRARAHERMEAMEQLGSDSPAESELESYLEHVIAEFSPRTCTTCNLFRYCRNELRDSRDPESLLVEIGVDPLTRPLVVGLIDGTGEIGHAPASTIANVAATLNGLPEWSRRRRTDPAGMAGTINVVLAKSDAAALGVHGIAIQRITADGPVGWEFRHFLEPQASQTRRAMMRLLGGAIREALAAGEGPIQLVVPDPSTADLLVSMADSLAGVELSRLRWQRDLDEGRPALTFDGEPAAIPDPLAGDERLAVSFLLEEDRARAMSLRQQFVNLRSVLASHVVAGGPDVDSLRLDYLVRWAEATDPLDHRAVSDEIAGELHTPGARLSNVESDAIHAALRTPPDPTTYATLVRDAVDYKIDVLERALVVLDGIEVSRVREIHRALESAAQEVWGRRLALQASDLVRFSRTYRLWRNDHVEMLDADAKCFTQLAVLADSATAGDRAQDAGVRELAVARVIGMSPVRLDVASRRLVDGTTVAALHINDEPIVERASTSLKTQAGSFKFAQVPIGPLAAEDGVEGMVWHPHVAPSLAVGDTLILADMTWFGGGFRSGHELAVKRPTADNRAAPKPGCTLSSYAQSPEEHLWCCRPHEAAEAEWSDTLAGRRERGELNPETWPPLVDEERFDVVTVGSGADPVVEPSAAPSDLTLDDIE